MRLDRRRQAELIDSVAIGYGGCKSDKGFRAMERLVKALRKG